MNWTWILDLGGELGAPAEGAEAGKSEEISLDLDLPGLAEPPKPPAPPDGEEDIEKLKDMLAKVTPGADAGKEVELVAPGAQDLALDADLALPELSAGEEEAQALAPPLSEELPAEPAEPIGAGDIDISDLELELGPEAEGPAKAPPEEKKAAPAEPVAELEFDLEVPELAEKEAAGAKAEQPVADLDLGELEPAPPEAKAEKPPDEELAIDLDSFELTVDTTEQVAKKKAEPAMEEAPVDLDFDLGEIEVAEEPAAAAPPPPAAGAAKGPAQAGDTIEMEQPPVPPPAKPAAKPVVSHGRPTMTFETGAGDLAEAEEEAVTEEEAVPFIPKRGLGWPLRIALLCVIVAGVAFAAVGVKRYMGSGGHGKIAEEQGVRKPEIVDADVVVGKTVNEKAGPVVYVTGKVWNRYDKPRSSITVKARVLDKSGKPIEGAEEIVYAGNSLTRPEIASLDEEAIKQRYGNPKGASGSNVNVKPNTWVPFAVVFFHLPEDAEEVWVGADGVGRETLLTRETVHVTGTALVSGDVAQSVRACGSYPQCPGFKSLHRHQKQRV